MNQPSLPGKIVHRLVLLAIALAYLAWMIANLPLTGYARLDGVIGVLGGLYICSHPATTFVDLLFFGRHSGIQWKSNELVIWIAFNLVVFLLGVLMISTGATRFV